MLLDSVEIKKDRIQELKKVLKSNYPFIQSRRIWEWEWGGRRGLGIWDAIVLDVLPSL